jgi:hypothetical protein
VSVTERPVSEGSAGARGWPAGLPSGFDVTYESPSSGTMILGQTGAFTVDGAEVALHRTDRFANPFGTTPAGAPEVEVALDGATLSLDTERWTRHASLRRDTGRR